jgi:hypothetical protein
MKRAILFALFGASLVAMPAASIGSVDLSLDCSPDSVAAKVQIWQVEQNKAEIAAMRGRDWTLCEELRSIGEGAFDTLFGKPSKEASGFELKRSPPGYAIPMFQSPSVGFSGLGYKGNTESRFYPLEDLGGVLMFPYGDGKFVSAVFIYLKVDDKFVPVGSTADYRARMDWDRTKLDRLELWLEEQAKIKGIDLHKEKAHGTIELPPEKSLEETKP